MLTFCYLLTLAQGLPPNPDAVPPQPSPGMILTIQEIRPRVGQTLAEREARQIQQQVMEVITGDRIRITASEQTLMLAVVKAATPMAFRSDGEARRNLLDAVRKMRAGVSPRVLKAIGALDLPKSSSNR